MKPQIQKKCMFYVLEWERFTIKQVKMNFLVKGNAYIFV